MSDAPAYTVEDITNADGTTDWDTALAFAIADAMGREIDPDCEISLLVSVMDEIEAAFDGDTAAAVAALQSGALELVESEARWVDPVPVRARMI